MAIAEMERSAAIQDNTLSVPLPRFSLYAERGVKLLSALNAAYAGRYAFNSQNIQNAWYIACRNETLRLVSCAYRELINPEDSISFRVETESGMVSSIHDVDGAYYWTHNSETLHPTRIVMHNNGGEKELAHPVDALVSFKDLIARVYGEVKDEGWNKLLEVSVASVENETLSVAVKQKWEQDLVNTAKLYSTLWEWVGLQPNMDSYDFFSRYGAFRGRYEMAFSKMKLPLPVEDVIQYAPEFGFDIPIHLAAIHKSQAEVHTANPKENIHQLFAKQYGETYDQWKKSLEAKSLNPDDYIPLPMHPLSRKLAEGKLVDYIAQNQFVFLEDAIIPSHAVLSFRSLIPTNSPSAPEIKLPVPVQTTGVIRSLSNAEVTRGPTLSNAFRQIHADNANFEDRLYLEGDVAGIRVKPSETITSEDSKYLACLLRDNPKAMLRQGETIMPLAALFATSPITHQPIIADIMVSSGVKDRDQALDYFKEYADLIFGGQLGIYIASGAIYEPHQQNLNLVFTKEGKLSRMIYHDLVGGISAYRPGFAVSGNDTTVLDGIPHVFDTPDASIRQFIHTNLWCNLLSIIHPISKAFDIDRSYLLDVIRRSFAEQVAIEREKLENETSEKQHIFGELLDKLEVAILKSQTIPVERLFGKIYQQSQDPGWGTIPHPNPEVFNPIKLGTKDIPNPLYESA